MPIHRNLQRIVVGRSTIVAVADIAIPGVWPEEVLRQRIHSAECQSRVRVCYGKTRLDGGNHAVGVLRGVLRTGLEGGPVWNGVQVDYLLQIAAQRADIRHVYYDSEAHVSLNAQVEAVSGGRSVGR